MRILENKLSISMRRTGLLGLIFYLGFLPLLTLLPYWFPVQQGVASAASQAGYNNQIAYLLAIAWSGICILAFALCKRFGYLGSPIHLKSESFMTSDSSLKAKKYKFYSAELVTIALVITTLYFPLFLTKHGPYIEDQVFLNALHRMISGQHPYNDFEFLYGPLMIYPAFFWIELFGYSMMSYYSYITILEILTFIALMMILQRYIPKPRERFIAFIIISILLFNTLLGPNQNGLRKLLPIYIMLLITKNPSSLIITSISAFLLGIQLTYSHEYGFAALAAIMVMYGLLIFQEYKYRYLLLAMGVLGVSAIVWYIVSVLIMGNDFSAYIQETRYLIEQFGAGEAGFRFYWTLNSLAIFGVLCLACIIVGQGIGNIRYKSISSGDLFLLCGLIYALVGLKSGLNRCDLWHLNPPILALMFAFLLPSATSLFAYSARVQHMAVALLVIVAATYLLGLMPTGSFYARGWFNGLRDTIAPEHSIQVSMMKTRAPTILTEKSRPNPDALRLGGYLAETAQFKRPVLFYGDLWALGPHVGVYKTDFINDDFLYSEERGHKVKAFLQARHEAIVLMRRPAYERLFGLADPRRYPEFLLRYTPSITKRLASWLSTVHYEGVEREFLGKEQRWTRTVGNYVRQHYTLATEFGDIIVLMRREKA